MSDTESIWEIIKDGCKKCFEAETSTEAGRTNLIGALICGAFVIIAMGTSTIDKIIWLFNNNYESGLPWYAIVALIFGFLFYFYYCVSKIIKINKINEEKNSSQVNLATAF
ncbi:hypothetical protein [Clostridium neonatale]|uniref:hypothetical protein n=1 Tax=Clostridium neonatale TaxID=137838 RepID=UPI00291C01DE|nr:hypothetical protein [Clostridium neonatale]CAI3537760.1 conserved hypothetical protein [Clostridium neonatale]CAI3628304.1 conserved hypothetical protein [Clostridium neonatale]CAI3658837.1 conserved hypothetical protein [Clostridium neonatale]CAI3660816.1 conserved hypothetical protein [Clostridium neonatale]